jgi:hypothetical protein
MSIAHGSRGSRAALCLLVLAAALAAYLANAPAPAATKPADATIASVAVSPKSLGLGGGTVTISAKVAHASSCTLKLLGSQGLKVAVPKTSNCSKGVYHAKVEVGRTPAKHTITLDLVVTSGDRATATKVLYVALLPSGLAPTPAPQASPTTATASGTACTDPVWSSSGQLDQWSDGPYLVNNNVWNQGEAGPQTIHACSWNNWYVVSNQPALASDSGSIKTGPDTEYNFVSQPWACSTTTDCGPAISSFSSITSTFSFTVPTAPDQDYDVNYDTWVGGLNNNACTEVMVWNEYGGQQDPGTYQTTIGGISYDVDHNGFPSGKNCGYDAFVMTRQESSGSVNLLAIYQFMVAHRWITSSESLSAIEYGVEIASTNGPHTYALNDYSLTVNGSSIS